MVLDSCIMFESVGVANLAMPELWQQKSSGSTLSENRCQTHLIGMKIHQAKLLGSATPIGPKS
jgi:hypothetical protein